ncbi:MAG: Uma2 family endonuclease, partial [Microcystaceae cyanobacterium]
WQVMYKNVELPCLRGWDDKGKLLPTPEEALVEAKQRAEQEKQRADHLEAKLRELGVNLDEL